MRARLSFVWAALAVVASMAAVPLSPALAGGAGCATCYRQIVQPPIVGVLHEHVKVHPARRLTHVIPAQYATMARKVLIAPARRVWQETRDASGHLVGCWVTIPAQYRIEHRHVRVSAPRVVHERMPALYASRPREVLLDPGRIGWQPASAYELAVKADPNAPYHPYPF